MKTFFSSQKRCAIVYAYQRSCQVTQTRKKERSLGESSHTQSTVILRWDIIFEIESFATKIAKYSLNFKSYHVSV